MSLSGLLNKVVDLRRPQIVKDASGGAGRLMPTVDGYAGMACAIQPLSNEVKQKFAARNLFVTHVVYFDFDAAIKKGDVLHEPETGRNYVVEGFENQAGRDFLWAAYGLEQLP